MAAKGIGPRSTKPVRLSGSRPKYQSQKAVAIRQSTWRATPQVERFGLDARRRVSVSQQSRNARLFRSALGRVRSIWEYLRCLDVLTERRCIETQIGRSSRYCSPRRPRSAGEVHRVCKGDTLDESKEHPLLHNDLFWAGILEISDAPLPVKI